MGRRMRRCAVPTAALLLAGLASAGSAQEGEEPTADAPSLTVELLSLEEGGAHGVVRIFSLRGEGRGGEGEAGGGALHPHRFVVELRGLEPGRSHPVHLHHGSCSEGGPVLLPLTSVEAGEDGSGRSATVLTPGEMMARLRELAGEDGEGGNPHGMLHPPFFVQAHLPGGAPAACGDLLPGGGETDDAVVTVVRRGEIPYTTAGASPDRQGTGRGLSWCHGRGRSHRCPAGSRSGAAPPYPPRSRSRRDRDARSPPSDGRVRRGPMEPMISDEMRLCAGCGRPIAAPEPVLHDFRDLCLGCCVEVRGKDAPPGPPPTEASA